MRDTGRRDEVDDGRGVERTDRDAGRRAAEAWDEAARVQRIDAARDGVARAHEQRGDQPVPDEIRVLPVSDAAIEARTTEHRIDLADDVPATELTPTYGGYLDVVMHGDATGTEAAIEGERVQFTLDELSTMITRAESWEQRPIRLMSCSTGQESLAQELADRIGVPVYAPSDVLNVGHDGRTWVDADGSWRRFEPSA